MNANNANSTIGMKDAINKNDADMASNTTDVDSGDIGGGGVAFRRQDQRVFHRLVAFLSCMVVLITAVALTLPAVSATKDSLGANGEQASSVAAETEEPLEGDAQSKADAADGAENADAEDNGESAGAGEGASGGESASSGDDSATSENDSETTTATQPADQDGDTASHPTDTDAGTSIVDSKRSTQSFYQELKNKAGKTTLTVSVEAPEGALPEGATMHVKPVKADEVQAAVEEAIAEEDSGRVEEIQAVDISFQNADGDEIEPAQSVSVRLSSPKIAAAIADDDRNPRIVHVDNDGEATIVDPIDDDELSNRQLALADDEVLFDADSFSVYVIAYTVDFSYGVGGEQYEFSLQGGDSTTMRELTKALSIVKDDKSTPENELDEFNEGIETVEFSEPEYLNVSKTEKASTVADIIKAQDLHVVYPLGLTMDEVLALNHKEYDAGEWVLVSLRAFDTEETLTITMDSGEVFTIAVTDAQDAVMVGDQVQTISNPAGTTIDLFDYWIMDQSASERDAWPNLDKSKGAEEAHDGSLNGTGNNQGINSSADDEVHGHALKFSPAWAGTVYNGNKIGETGNAWESVNKDGRNGLNSYTGDADPFQGIVQNTLEGGYPKLSNNQDIGATGESLGYLFNPGTNHAGKASYPDVNQLLYVDKDGYYTYDSRDYAAAFHTDSKTFTLTEQTSNNTEYRGFWPFGLQNFWSGLHINTQFSMPANGQVLNPRGENKDMQFEFSGDDDTWLYVDGVLVGDGGGIHNRTEIDINFATGKVTVTGKKGGTHAGDFEETKWLDDIFNSAGKGPNNPEYADEWEDIGDGSGHKRFKPGTYHTFDMFYLERGGGESNLYIHYNLVSTADFTAHKTLNRTEEDEALRRDQFQFELVGFDGKYAGAPGARTLVNGQENAAAIMPTGGTEGGAGTVASPKCEHVGSAGGQPGYTSFITGVTEDGNVNFGQAQISDEDKQACDAGNPPTYRYMVREIVPDDAVNTDGVSWGEATDEQKAVGGFVKDNITYDGHVYYFEGTVRKEHVIGSDGNSYPKYDLKKTRYADSTYTQIDTNTKFYNFVNACTPDFGNVDFTKVNDGGAPLSGATFALYKDQACTIPAKNVDIEGTPEWTATSGSDGRVEFNNVRVGTYYMKETSAPSPYALDNTVYQVVIEDSEDPTKHSRITVLGDASEAAVTEIVNTQPGQLTVKKKWLNAAGAEVDGGSNSATVRLYRAIDASDVPAVGPNVSVVFHRDGASWNLDTGDGNAVNVINITAFDLFWHLGNDSSHQLHDMKVNGISVSQQNEVVDLGIAKVKWIPWDNDRNSSILEVRDIKQDLSIEYNSNCDWFSEKPKVTYKVGFKPPIIDTTPVAIGTLELDSNNEWSRTLRIGGTLSTYTTDGYDLPQTDDDGYSYQYKIVELNDQGNEISIGDVATGDYELQGYSPNNSTGVSDQGQLVVYNKEKQGPTVSLNVVKIAAHETGTARTYLDGAVFRLEKKNANSVYEAYSNDANGEGFFEGSDFHFTVSGEQGVTIQGLTDGDYQLIEVSPPAGYLKTEGAYTFSVASGAIAEGSPTALVEYTQASSDNPAQFAVINEPGKPLPYTGGQGTVLFMQLGTLLVALAGIALVWIRKRHCAAS